jgi:hypothetical protein
MPSLGREAKRREREPGEVEGVREKRNQVEDRDRVKERGLSQRKRSNFGVASLAPILIFSRSRALTYLQEHVLASDVKFMTTSWSEPWLSCRKAQKRAKNSAATTVFPSQPHHDKQRLHRKQTFS